MKKLGLLLMIVFVVALAGAALMAQRAPQVPRTSGPMLDVANKIADAINKQDTDALQKMVAPNCIYLDEDGHAPPVARWITTLTTGTPAKTIAISSTHSQIWGRYGLGFVQLRSERKLQRSAESDSRYRQHRRQESGERRLAAPVNSRTRWSKKLLD